MRSIGIFCKLYFLIFWPPPSLDKGVWTVYYTRKRIYCILWPYTLKSIRVLQFIFNCNRMWSKFQLQVRNQYISIAKFVYLSCFEPFMSDFQDFDVCGSKNCFYTHFRQNTMKNDPEIFKIKQSLQLKFWSCTCTCLQFNWTNWKTGIDLTVPSVLSTPLPCGVTRGF